MKKRIAIVAAAVLCLGVFLLLSGQSFPGWDAPEILSRGQSRAIEDDLFRAAEVCRGAEGPDAMEARLIEAGFATVDTDPVYPAYLANAQSLRAFSEEKEADTAVLRVNDDGSIFHLFFSKGKENFLLLTKISSAFQVSEWEVLPLYEAELSEWDVFYYRCYPAGDPHYIDYNFFRLSPADRELYDLTSEYILPVGYRMVNLFLCDWQEGNWDSLSINDTFEYLYELQTGQVFPWQEYPAADSGYLRIPAKLFEDTVQPFFAISLAELRAAARYDEATDTYPWRPVHGDDLTAWDLPVCQPEVVKWTENPDGTLTLTVQVASPEKKTDALFIHEVTIRLLEDGRFQYVGNRITYVNQWGLPPTLARFELYEG